MKITRSIIVLFIAFSLIFSSCTSKNHPRKCNGKRGTRVPMGVL